MTKKRYHLNLENLEHRQLLAADLWFADSGQSLGTNTDGAQFADLDGDDDLDVLVGCRAWPGGDQCTETAVWLNDGNGQFSKGWTIDETNVGRFDLGDLDGDGDLDVYIVKGSPEAPDNPTFGERDSVSKVWFNDGHGSFQDSGQLLDGLDSSGNDDDDGAFSVTLGDVDGDGDLDAVAAHPVGPSLVWLNDGTGHFSDSGQQLAPAHWTINIALADVDGDQDLDAYFARGVDSPTDLLYLNDGQGNFTDSGQKLDSRYTIAVRLADLDGDNDLDAFIANGNTEAGVGQPNRVYFNDGAGNFTDSGQSLGREISNSVELTDLDGDGDIDAFVSNGVLHREQDHQQPNEIWLNDGSGVFTLGQQLGDAASYRVVLSDVDNDGDLDAFVGNIGQDNQVLINTQAIPFMGSIQEVETQDLQPSTFFVDGSGSGNATLLGNYTMTFQFEVETATLLGIGTAHFIAADGDSLFTKTTATATVPDPTATVVEMHNIVGGTGRLAGATGSFILERLVNVETGISSGSFDGTIQINTQPLRGDFEATENAVDPTQFPIFTQIGSGSGYATNLGRYTMTYQIEVDALSFVGVGSANFIAANGDSLYTNVQGLGTDPALDPIATVVEKHTITGGTGQFAFATGSFTLERLVDTRTGVTSGAFDGGILIAQSIPGDSNHDGIFSSSDLVLAFQAGEYEDDIVGNSTFEEGDWDRDGDFTTSDLVYAFQANTWVNAAVSESLFASADPNRETQVVKRRDITTDRLVEIDYTEIVDQVFAEMLL